MTDITISESTSVEELQKVSELEREIWGTEPIPIHQTLTAVQHGGIVLAAYSDNQVVGFLYGFPGFHDGEVYFCSHIMGIHPNFQKQKIGEQLKLRQRDIAEQKGYSSIIWTFDPLLSLNAYLNLHKLGAVAVRYIENHYGNMSGSLNSGLPTDRFQVRWAVASKFVAPIYVDEYNLEHVLFDVELDHDILPVIVGEREVTFAAQPNWIVPIPKDFLELKSRNLSLARDWRMKTRRNFEELFDAGFVAVDLIRTDHQVNYYVFVRSED